VTLDQDSAAYLERVASLGAPVPGEAPVDELRSSMDAAAPGLFGPLDEVGSVVEQTLPGPAGGPLRVRVYEPAGARPYPVLVYLHGGGWVVGSLQTHDGVCRALASRTPCVVVAVDYRLAPEHRFPAAVEDAWAATAWVAEHAASIGGDLDRIAVGGDSAGGTLATACAIRARDHGLRLALQLLVYPVTDHRFDTASYEECAEGYGLTRDAMRWYWAQYLGPGEGSTPEASPLRAPDLGGLAPAHVVTAEYDPLRDEAEAYAARLEEAGVRVRLDRCEGLIHGFLRMPGTIRRADAVLDDAAAALREAFAAVPA
jgi:acetyl esterase